MKSKQTALLADLARLLTKYSARDWQPFVRVLTKNPRALVEAMEALSSVRPGATKKRASTKRRSTEKVVLPIAKPKIGAVSKKARVDRPKKERFAEKEDVISYKTLLNRASLGDLQAFYVEVFNEKRMPKTRSEIVALIDAHLNKLPKNARDAALVHLSRGDSTDTFRKWAEIISKTPTQD